MCCEILSIGDSDIGFREGSPSTSRVVKSRENRSHPSEEDRWQRSMDLVNLEVRKVRAQRLGALSHEKKNSEELGQPSDSGQGRTIGS
jgi:hypothetical protein